MALDANRQLSSFFSAFADSTTTDNELKELINTLRYIQFDRTLLETHKTSLISEQMIKNIKMLSDTDVNTTFTNDKATIKKTALGEITNDDIKNVKGSGEFYFATNDKFIRLRVEMSNSGNEATYEIEKTEKTLASNPSYAQVHNHFIKEKLKELLDENVYRLYSTPVKDIDSLSNGSKAFKHLNFSSNDYLYNKSLIDIILECEKYADKTELTSDSNKDMLTLLESMYDWLNKMQSESPTDENSLIMDIVKFQDNIEKSKESIKEERNKIYTYLARDENYTKTLRTKRMMLYLSIVFFILLSLLYMGLAYTKTISVPDKTTIVLATASIVLFTNMVIYIMRFSYKKVETFSEPPSLIGKIKKSSINGFTSSLTDENKANIKMETILTDFCTKYSEVLSKEIKNEYYDTLYESKMKDQKLLDQLEKEHNLKSHFHRLKNSLTHFKINETKEYSKLAQLAIVLISLLAILYLAVIQDTIDMQIFKIVSGLVFVIYVTYMLLTIKSIMIRDKYDWDRFHWTVKNVKNTVNNQNCPLPGFPN